MLTVYMEMEVNIQKDKFLEILLADLLMIKEVLKYNVDDYNEYFMNQLFELLTEYGPIHEVWFDGAHPKKKR